MHYISIILFPVTKFPSPEIWKSDFNTLIQFTAHMAIQHQSKQYNAYWCEVLNFWNDINVWEAYTCPQFSFVSAGNFLWRLSEICAGLQTWTRCLTQWTWWSACRTDCKFAWWSKDFFLLVLNKYILDCKLNEFCWRQSPFSFLKVLQHSIYYIRMIDKLQMRFLPLG